MLNFKERERDALKLTQYNHRKRDNIVISKHTNQSHLMAEIKKKINLSLRARVTL